MGPGLWLAGSTDRPSMYGGRDSPTWALWGFPTQDLSEKYQRRHRSRILAYTHHSSTAGCGEQQSPAGEQGNTARECWMRAHRSRSGPAEARVAGERRPALLSGFRCQRGQQPSPALYLSGDGHQRVEEPASGSQATWASGHRWSLELGSPHDATPASAGSDQVSGDAECARPLG